MKVVILLLLLVAYCIDAKCPKCAKSDNCGTCTKYSNCVWCDQRCISKYEKIGCETRIEDSESCPSDFNACIAAICPTNTRCEEDEDGNPVCIPLDPCSVVRCGNGPCVVVDGKAQCVDNPCVRTECDDGLICVLDDEGKAECVDNPCKWAKCSSGYTCQPNPDGSGSSCVKTTGCEYNGNTYQEGDSFSDGCNTCSCSEGRVICTKMACFTCTTDNDCTSGKYCAKQSCDDSEGFCANIPEICEDIFKSVCGCDGQTYDNDCYAAREGVNVNYEGECVGGSEGECTKDTDCKDGSFCDYYTCAKDSGFCTERYADFCASNYEPVCGCDGVTYNNDCERASAGATKLLYGECPVCDPVCEKGASLCCPGCGGTTFCSTENLFECPLFKCVA